MFGTFLRWMLFCYIGYAQDPLLCDREGRTETERDGDRDREPRLLLDMRVS